MADIEIDVNRTALLMADFHTAGMTENPMVQEWLTLDRAREVLHIARWTGVFVAYIVVNFRSGDGALSRVTTIPESRSSRYSLGAVGPRSSRGASKEVESHAAKRNRDSKAAKINNFISASFPRGTLTENTAISQR